MSVTSTNWSKIWNTDLAGPTYTDCTERKVVGYRAMKSGVAVRVMRVSIDPSDGSERVCWYIRIAEGPYLNFVAKSLRGAKDIAEACARSVL